MYSIYIAIQQKDLVMYINFCAKQQQNVYNVVLRNKKKISTKNNLLQFDNVFCLLFQLPLQVYWNLKTLQYHYFLKSILKQYVINIHKNHETTNKAYDHLSYYIYFQNILSYIFNINYLVHLNLLSEKLITIRFYKTLHICRKCAFSLSDCST